MTSKTSSKVAAFAAAIAVVTAVAIAPLAHAQTTSTSTTTTTSTAALQAEIASLQAQLAASQGTSMSGSMMSTQFTTDLTVGSTGSMVTALQNWLIAKGYSIPAGATGYFGAQTKAALAAYQAANGISPAAGYFGPITRAKVNASGSTTTTTTTTTTTGSMPAGCVAGAMYSSTTGQACGTMTTTTGGSLTGGEGTINNFQTVGATSVTMGTGSTQPVMGFQFQAGGSDLAVSRIYYDFYNNTGNGTTRPWNIFQTATITDGTGKTIATIDASNQANYSEDGVTSNGTQIYRLGFENVNQTVKMGTTVQYYLNLTTDSAFATGNVTTGTQFNIGLAGQGLRATDAMGIQEYTTTNSTLSVVNINSNSTGSVSLSTGSDNPQTTTVMANSNTATLGVVLNTFTLQNEGQSPVELYTLPVTVTTTNSGGTNTPSNVVQTLRLYQGSTLLDTESPSASFTSGSNLNFKNINLVIPAGTTDSFRITADIQPVNGNGITTNPAQSGASVTVSVPGAVSGTDIETTGGSLITVSGASTGYPISFAVNGLSVASTPTSATASSALASGGGSTAQTGTFTFVFNVTSFGQTIYVASTSGAYSLTVIDNSTGVAATGTVSSALTTSANRSPDGNYQINSGQTVTFTVTASLTGGSGHYYHAILNSLNYGSTDAASTASTVTLPSNYTTNATVISS